MNLMSPTEPQFREKSLDHFKANLIDTTKTKLPQFNVSGLYSKTPKILNPDFTQRNKIKLKLFNDGIKLKLPLKSSTEDQKIQIRIR